ncbi:MAG: hypothetical protein PVF51_03780 [Nitrospirota bacterium]
MASLAQAQFTNQELRGLIAARLGDAHVPRRFKVVHDTSEFFQIDYNDVVVLDHTPYLMRNYEREGRFGLEDEPKYWVRRAVDLATGDTKVIKLVFDEAIEAKVGGVVFHCVRSPHKEAAILDLTRGHGSFMQGFSARDVVGNTVRILDFIPGARLDEYVAKRCRDHEAYYQEELPGLLAIYAELVAAIGLLHGHGYKHGDIRRDHILLDPPIATWRWIDFDYDYAADANPFGYDLFGLGNILIFLVGGGDVTTQILARSDASVLESLTTDDLNIVFNHRVANLQKIYPYIDDSLAYVLRHFSQGADVFYEDTGQLLADLAEVRLARPKEERS